MYLIHVTPESYELRRPDGTVCAWFPRSEDVEEDDNSYAQARDLQDAMMDAQHAASPPSGPRA